MKSLLVLLLLATMGCSNLTTKERVPNQVGNDIGGKFFSDENVQKNYEDMGVRFFSGVKEDQMCGPAPAQQKCSEAKDILTSWNWKDFKYLNQTMDTKEGKYEVLFNALAFTVLQNTTTLKKITSPVAHVAYSYSDVNTVLRDICEKSPVKAVTDQLGKFRVLTKEEALALLDETGEFKEKYVDRAFKGFGPYISTGDGSGAIPKCTWVSSGELVCSDHRAYTADKKGVFRDEEGKNKDKGGMLSGLYYPVLCTSL